MTIREAITPLLVAHSRADVQRYLATELSGVEVRTAHDAFAAASEVSSGAFRGIIVEHPLMGFEADYTLDFLRQSGANCPLVVIAESLDETGRWELAQKLGQNVAVISSPDVREVEQAFGVLMPGLAGEDDPTGAQPAPDPQDPSEWADEASPSPYETAVTDLVDEPAAADFALEEWGTPPVEPADEWGTSAPDPEPHVEAQSLEAWDAPVDEAPADDGFETVPMDLLGEAPEAQQEEEAPVEEAAYADAETTDVNAPAVDVAGFLSASGSLQRALRVDAEACERWIAMSLPPTLIGLLDGAHSFSNVIAHAGMSPEETVAWLLALEDAGCLEDVDAPAAPPPPPRMPGPPPPPAQPALAPPEPEASPADEEGRIPETSIAHLLLSLKARRISGKVVVNSATWEMALALDGGDPVAAGGGPPETTIGAVLRSAGYLSEDGANAIAQEQRRLREKGIRASFGDVALRLGHLVPAQILEGLRLQMQHKVRVLVDVGEATFRVSYGTAGGLDPISDPPAVEWLVQRAYASAGAARDALVERFRSQVGRGGVRALGSATDLLPAFRFGPRVQRLVRLLDGRSLTDVLAENVVPREEAELTIALLQARGALELTTMAARPRPLTGSQPKVEALPTTPAGRPGFPRDAASHTPSGLQSRAEPAASRDAASRTPSGFHARAEPASARPSRSQGMPVMSYPEPPSTPALGGRERAVMLSMQAEEAASAKDYARAIGLLREATTADPSSASIRMSLGWATFRYQPGSQKARDEARRHLEQSLTIDDRISGAHVALGKIARLDGDVARARSFFEQAMALNPSDPDARKELEALEKVEKKDGPQPGADSSAGFFKSLFGRKG